MLTISRRRCRGLAAAALASVGLPAVAEAQLFPNLPIRRERPSCAQERPDYRYVRHEYYGYYPTCWRKFPPGWGCPSAEQPNSAAAMEDIRNEMANQAQPPPGAPIEGPVPGPDENQMAPPTRPEGEIPPLPRERSPFNMDSGNPANRPVNPAAPRGAGAGEPESGLPVTPRADATPRPRASSPTSPSGPGADVSEAPANTSEDPALSSNDDPAAPLSLLDVGNPSASPTTAAPVAGAGPGMLPFPASPEPTNPGTAPSPAAASGGYAPPPAFAPPPVQAPQRRSLLGGLFQGFNRRRR